MGASIQFWANLKVNTYPVISHWQKWIDWFEFQKSIQTIKMDLDHFQIDLNWYQFETGRNNLNSKSVYSHIFGFIFWEISNWFKSTLIHIFLLV